MSKRAGLARFYTPAAALLALWSAGGVASALADEPLAVEEIAPGVFVHAGEMALMSPENRGGIANVGFIVGEAAVAVIDSGGSVAEGRALLAAVRARTDLPVRFVINTHMHPDHVFGNAAFVELAPEIIGAARLPAALATRQAHYLRTSAELLGLALAGEVRILHPTVSVEQDLTLNLGRRPIRLRAWRAAHTDNDLTVLDERTGTLFGGDLVFLDHLPVIDGSIRGWLATIEALETVDAERVVPGHGPAAAPLPEALAPERRYLEAVAADVRERIMAGESIAQAPAGVAQEERRHWRLFDEFHARNVTAAFAELEWE